MQLLVLGVSTAAIYLSFATAVAIYFEATRFINVSFAATFVIAPYVFYWSARHGMPLPLAGLVALVAAGCIGGLSDSTVFRYLRSTKQTPLRALLASLGLYTIVLNLLVLTVGNTPQLMSDVFSNDIYQVGSVRVTSAELLSIVAAVVTIGGTYWLLFRTVSGRTYRAVCSNPELARLMGLPVNRSNAIACGVATALGGAASTLVALNTVLSPSVGFEYLLVGVTCFLAGGILGWRGLILGAAAVSAIQIGIGLFVGVRWSEVGVYALLVIILVMRSIGAGRVLDGPERRLA